MDEVERELRALLPDAEPGASVLAETLPETVPAAVPAAVAVPVVPASVAVPPAPEVAPVTPGARKGLIAVGVGAALLCVAVVVAILLVVRQKPPQDTAAQPPAPQAPASTSASAAPSTSPSSAPTSTPSPTPTPNSPPPISPTVSTVASAKTAADALKAYYALLPGNPAEAWKLLTDNFKASRHQTYDTYKGFWGKYRSVQASNVAEAGPNRVTAHITYDGGNGENDTFTMVQVGGVWMIDSQN